MAEKRKRRRVGELAWAAGFFDGEGCVSAGGGYPLIVIRQTELEPLVRFRAAIESDRPIRGPLAPYGFGRKQFWELRVNGRQRIAQVYRLLRPWLSGPKRAQFELHLGSSRPSDPRWQPKRCPTGHVVHIRGMGCATCAINRTRRQRGLPTLDETGEVYDYIEGLKAPA